MREGDVIHKTCRRYNTPGDAHELTFSCYRHQPLLLEDRTRLWLAESISIARERHKFDLWAWVFMPTHVHLLILPTIKEYSISDILQAIKYRVAWKELNLARMNDPDRLASMSTGQKHRPFRFWQDGGGFDKNLNLTEAIRNSVIYIHNNPLREGLAQTAEEWPWSSAREWSGFTDTPLHIHKNHFPLT